MRAAKFMHDLGASSTARQRYATGAHVWQSAWLRHLSRNALAQSGIPLDAIFRAGTINTARQFKLEKDYGTISAGKIANLLILDANPLETVRAWSMIDKVILHGKVIERESLAAQRIDAHWSRTSK